jgi:hypothetical protein
MASSCSISAELRREHAGDLYLLTCEISKGVEDKDSGLAVNRVSLRRAAGCCISHSVPASAVVADESDTCAGCCSLRETGAGGVNVELVSDLVFWAPLTTTAVPINTAYNARDAFTIVFPQCSIYLLAAALKLNQGY